MSRRTRWRDLSPAMRTAIVAAGLVELGLTVTAAYDLHRRPRQRLKGSKALWWAAIFVHPVGPVAYLAWARRDDGRSP